MNAWTLIANVLDRFPRVQHAIRTAARRVRAARAERLRPHSQRHLWDVHRTEQACVRCYTPRSPETEREACDGSTFFRRMAVE